MVNIYAKMQTQSQRKKSKLPKLTSQLILFKTLLAGLYIYPAHKSQVNEITVLQFATTVNGELRI